MYCIFINLVFCYHAFYTWASGSRSDERGNPIPRIGVNKLIDLLIEVELQQHAYRFRYALFSTLWDSSRPEKNSPWKIPLTFLFDWRHSNNVSAEALFHGGHLVVRSERWVVQNKWIILSSFRNENVKSARQRSYMQRY